MLLQQNHFKMNGLFFTMSFQVVMFFMIQSFILCLFCLGQCTTKLISGQVIQVLLILYSTFCACNCYSNRLLKRFHLGLSLTYEHCVEWIRIHFQELPALTSCLMVLLGEFDLLAILCIKFCMVACFATCQKSILFVCSRVYKQLVLSALTITYFIG